MKTCIYTFFCVLFLSACKPGIPKDIIQPDKMALILNDIHIADGYISSYQPDSAKIVAAAFYKGIYHKFKIDSPLFYKSMDYYYSNPPVMDDIYKKVNAGLLKQKLAILKVDSLKDAAAERKAELKKAADSIRKIDSLTNLRLKRLSDSVKKNSTIQALDSIKKAGKKSKKKTKVHKLITPQKTVKE